MIRKVKDGIEFKEENFSMCENVKVIDKNTLHIKYGVYCGTAHIVKGVGSKILVTTGILANATDSSSANKSIITVLEKFDQLLNLGDSIFSFVTEYKELIEKEKQTIIE